jgi:hypothetical protein
MRRLSPAARMRALLDVTDEADSLRVTAARAFASHMGLRLRWPEIRRGALKLGARAPDVQSFDDLVIHLDRGPGSATPTALASMMARIAARPLSGRMVIQALDISNRERLLWTKDGRLPATGFAHIRRGHLMSIPTYDPDRIQALTQAVIQSWREADAFKAIA